jgi:hypothetical protein
MPAILEDLAALAAAEGRQSEALTLGGGASASLRDRLGAPPSPAEQEQLQSWLGRASSSIGEPAAAEYWRRGRVMEAEQVIAYALEEHGA